MTFSDDLETIPFPSPGRMSSRFATFFSSRNIDRVTHSLRGAIKLVAVVLTAESVIVTMSDGVNYREFSSLNVTKNVTWRVKFCVVVVDHLRCKR